MITTFVLCTVYNRLVHNNTYVNCTHHKLLLQKQHPHLEKYEQTWQMAKNWISGNQTAFAVRACRRGDVVCCECHLHEHLGKQNVVATALDCAWRRHFDIVVVLYVHGHTHKALWAKGIQPHFHFGGGCKLVDLFDILHCEHHPIQCQRLHRFEHNFGRYVVHFGG